MERISQMAKISIIKKKILREVKATYHLISDELLHGTKDQRHGLIRY